MDLQNQRVTILGAKLSGMAMARLVTRRGGQAKISERMTEDSVPADFRQWAQQQRVACQFQGHTRPFIEASDWLVLSPGVPKDIPAVHWAQADNIPVLGEIEFAFQWCDKPVIAVTGSNGKTTVATLIHQVLEAAGYRSCLCGNIGTPFSDYVLDLFDKDFVVLEVSSFQLETILSQTMLLGKGAGIKGFKPYIAVILNVSQNHLDRHKDFQEYLDAKKMIFINQKEGDYAVLNAKDDHLKRLAQGVKSQVRYFDPSLMPLKGIESNPNFAAVWEIAKIIGIKEATVSQVLRDFKGVEHRLEWVRQINGVHFINDSKATTAQAAIWALERLNAPVIMICGGRDKNIDFSAAASLVRQKVKRMLLIGEARKKLREVFNGLVTMEECASLPEAVARANEIAQAGDSVLLSPMCASFDMFANYQERGRCFKEAVHHLSDYA